MGDFIKSKIKIPKKTERGWIVEIDEDFAAELGVAKGSIALMNAREGKIETEILSPSPELEKSIDRLAEKYEDCFAEMKKIGDLTNKIC